MRVLMPARLSGYANYCRRSLRSRLAASRRSPIHAPTARASCWGSSQLKKMENERTIFLLTVRPEPGVDGVRALRAWLKIGLRTFGLKCLRATTGDKEEANLDMRN